MWKKAGRERERKRGNCMWQLLLQILVKGGPSMTLCLIWSELPWAFSTLVHHLKLWSTGSSKGEHPFRNWPSRSSFISERTVNASSIRKPFLIWIGIIASHESLESWVFFDFNWCRSTWNPLDIQLPISDGVECLQSEIIITSLNGFDASLWNEAATELNCDLE